MSMPQSVPVKYMFAGSLRRTRLDTITFDELKARISDSFPSAFDEDKSLGKHLAFRYVDEDDEIVTITCDHELVEAFQQAEQKKRILHIYIDDIPKVESCNSLREQRHCRPLPRRRSRHPNRQPKRGEPKLCAKFLKDLSITDNTYVSRGEEITKIWRLSTRSGLPEGCRLEYTSGHALTPTCIVVARARPNSMFDVQLKFSAPEQDGEYRSYWRLVSPEGSRFGPKLWVSLNVCGEGSLHRATKKTKKDPYLKASFLEDITLPDASVIGRGQRATKIWRIKSEQAIPDGSVLRYLGGNLPSLFESIPITKQQRTEGTLEQVSGVPPKYAQAHFSPTEVQVICDGCNKRHLQRDESFWHCDLNNLDLCNSCKAKTDRKSKIEFYNVSADIIAPERDGRYRSFWRMISPNGCHFGPTLWCDVCVGQASMNGHLLEKKQAPRLPAKLDATFLEDVTIPDGCEVEAGGSLQKIWRLRTNSGIPSGCRIVFASGDKLAEGETYPLPIVAPRGEFDLYLKIQVPSQPGSYRSDWRIVSPQGKRFGPSLWIDLQVKLVESAQPSENLPPCVTFMQDVLLSDGSNVQAQKNVKKTWRLKSSQPLPKGTTLEHAGGDDLTVTEEASFEIQPAEASEDDFRKTFGLPREYCSSKQSTLFTVKCDGCEKKRLQRLNEGYWHSAAKGEDFCTTCYDSGKHKDMHEIDVSISFTTPDQAGRSRSFWKLVLEDGQCFGPKLWIDMNVEPEVVKPEVVESEVVESEVVESEVVEPEVVESVGVESVKVESVGVESVGVEPECQECSVGATDELLPVTWFCWACTAENVNNTKCHVCNRNKLSEEEANIIQTIQDMGFVTDIDAILCSIKEHNGNIDLIVQSLCQN